MYFGIPTAARQAYVLVCFGIFSPFFAPAACWCALQEVLSIETSCISASADRDSKRFWNTPFWFHKRKREYTVFQDPNRSGRSRQGEPVLDLQSIPLSISRFDFDGLPLPVFSGGIVSFMRSQSWSLISWRLIITFQSSLLVLENYPLLCYFVQHLFFRHALGEKKA